MTTTKGYPMNTMTETPMPTEKQFGFIDSLLADREVPTAIAQNAADTRLTMTRKEASALIDTLLKFPKKPKAPKVFSKPVYEPADSDYPAVKAILATLPKARYAVPTDMLHLEDMVDKINGSLFFMEIKEYQGTIYARKLTGAPGAFSRSKIATKDLLVLLQIIATDPYLYTKTFGEHYSCCGKCGAELTDDKSRMLQLGPDCRKAFGF